jgi:hypothetical protein
MTNGSIVNLQSSYSQNYGPDDLSLNSWRMQENFSCFDRGAGEKYPNGSRLSSKLFGILSLLRGMVDMEEYHPSFAVDNCAT